MKRRESENPRNSVAKRPLLRGAIRLFALLAIWSIFFAALFLAWCAYDLPGLDRLSTLKRRPSVTLLAADGALLASYGDLYGAAVRLSDLPTYLPGAILATEDRRFFSHFGIDVIGLARAIYVNIREGALVQGGSTITQQLAKNVFLTPERTLHRKGQELLLALILEHSFTKEQILELYLNRVYFGAGAYGVDAAARKYFQKPASQVSLYEAAMLAGLLKAPSRFNPFNDGEQAGARARLVIGNMVAAGIIGEAQAEAAAQSSAMANPSSSGQIGQHFANWVADQVASYVGYGGADLVVETTLDPAMQRLAEASLKRIVETDGKTMNASQGALVAMTPDGAVRAMVGGADYRSSQFNRATQALRQPGSAFKTFVYLAGFEHGLTPDSRFVDGPIAIGKWRPGNYQDKYLGEVNLREAFARSLNSVAVQVSERSGRSNVIAAAKRLGITETLDQTPAIALGVSETTLIEMTGAYATFANLGAGVWPRGIERIRTSDGVVLYERRGDGPGQVVAGGPVNEMLDVMAAVTDWGTGKRARLDRPTYGKTGTSQEFRDAWFIGLTRDLVTGVWVGNDDGAPMDKVTGGTLPVAIWRDFMSQALAGQPPEDVRRPRASQALASLSSGGTIGDAAASGEDVGFAEWLQQEIFSNDDGGSDTIAAPSQKTQNQSAMPERGTRKD
jgi:penicillin-binding protein 1A